MTKGNGNYKNNGPKKEFAPSFGFWPAKSGNGFRVFLDEKMIETLKKAQVGGSLYLKEVPQEARDENDRLPHFRITIFAPDEAPAASESL